MCANLHPVLETALLEAVNGVIRADDLSLPIGQETPTGCSQPSRTDNLSLDAVIRHHVQYVLDLNRGNKLRTPPVNCALAAPHSTAYWVTRPSCPIKSAVLTAASALSYTALQIRRSAL